MEEAEAGKLRYKAFLSYSHKDSAIAARLHRRLETYRMPKRLIGTSTPRGPVPERLWPIFRDRDELPAATDLSETVREALAQSGSLVILCSPHAAASLWVAEEIETFRRLYPDRSILAAIVEGDPPECFPAALRAFGRDGTWHEPLATDLRAEGDGPHLGLLKLVAGITGVGLDALVQRDASRRIRRVTAVTAGALAAMLLMAALTLVALDARNEAERQRAEAEGQIEFMLTDLRSRLKGVGRLDIMDAVNRRSLAYYDKQELTGLNPDSLERRARILQAIGEDALERGNISGSRAAFRESHRTTAEQLDRAPRDSARIFAHSQSEFYVGHIAFEQGDFVSAQVAFERYKALADRLTAINPRNVTWLKEGAYAEGSICTVLWQGLRDIPAALDRCAVALRRMEQAARASGHISDFRSDLANRHADLADTLLAAGRLNEALLHQQRRLSYLVRQLQDEPANARLIVRRAWALRGLANVEAHLGHTRSANARMIEAIRLLENLVRHDPENRNWRNELGKMRLEIDRLRQPRRL
jgi:tetratricopeptide (TPR) repeat protein